MGSLRIDQGSIEEAFETITTLQGLVDSLGEVTPVHGAFYELSAKYYKVGTQCSMFPVNYNYDINAQCDMLQCLFEG